MCVSLGTPVSYTNKAYRHDITEILLKATLNTIALTLFRQSGIFVIFCRSVLFFGETGVLGENHRPVAIHLKNVSYKAADTDFKL